MSTNFFLDNDDLKFQFENAIDWEEIVELVEAGYKLPGGHANLQEAKEFYRAVMESVGEFAAEFIAPRTAAIDRDGTWLENGEVKFGKALTEVFDNLKERELFGMPVPRELGGANCPMSLFFITGELFARADVSIMTHFGFHGGIALALLMYAAREGSLKVENGEIKSTRWEEAIREIAAGKEWGAMVLTEPDAGSDLARIRAKAVERNGTWYLTGEKIFITSGHGQYHLVLARTEDGLDDSVDPLKRLSLFLVPRILRRDGVEKRNFEVSKVEEKIGHHGSATCSLNYEDSEAELVGTVGQGFELMLLLMNNARVAVGFEAIGLCEAAYRMARQYASERTTMGVKIDHHPVVAEMLMDMELDIAGMRAMALAAANHVELSSRLDMLLQVDPPTDPYKLKQLERRASKHRRRARMLTPLLKLVAAEAAVRISRNNMQIHGGPGYITEVGADKLLRDALVLPVYEGTSQIQALMAFKDNMLAALRSPGPFARDAARAHLLSTTAPSETERLFHRSEAALYQSLLAIVARIAGGKVRRTVSDKGWSEIREVAQMSTWDPKIDFAQGLVHAERFAQAMGDLECARALLAQAAKFPERSKLATRYVRRMHARVGALTSAILHNDPTVFEWISELQT